jgi:hypothetical protein
MGLASRLPCKYRLGECSDLQRFIALNHFLIGFTKDVEASKPDMKLLTDHLAMYIVGTSFEGAADTKQNTLQGFIKVSSCRQHNTRTSSPMET